MQNFLKFYQRFYEIFAYFETKILKFGRYFRFGRYLRFGRHLGPSKTSRPKLAWRNAFLIKNFTKFLITRLRIATRNASGDLFQLVDQKHPKVFNRVCCLWSFLAEKSNFGSQICSISISWIITGVEFFDHP